MVVRFGATRAGLYPSQSGVSFTPASLNPGFYVNPKTNLFSQGSAVFNGTTSLMNAADSTSLNLSGGSFSLYGWMNFGSIAAADSVVLSKGTSATSNTANDYTVYYKNSAGKIVFSMSKADGSGFWECVSSLTPSTSTWYFISSVYDSSQQKMFIYNGTTLIATLSSVTQGSLHTAASLYIGGLNGTASFTGSMFGIGIVKGYALTSTDLTTLYASGTGINYNDLSLSNSAISHCSAYWDCCQSSSTTTEVDQTGFNDLTKTNITHAQASNSSGVKVRKAGFFNSTDPWYDATGKNIRFDNAFATTSPRCQPANLNGYSGVVISSTNCRTQSIGFSTFGAQQHSVWAIVKNSNFAAIRLLSKATSATGILWGLTAANKPFLMQLGGATLGTAAAAIPTNTWSTLSYSIDATAGTAILYLNGSATDTLSFTPITLAAGEITIGLDTINSYNFNTAQFEELLFDNSIYTGANFTSLYGYASTTYGI